MSRLTTLNYYLWLHRKLQRYWSYILSEMETISGLTLDMEPYFRGPLLDLLHSTLFHLSFKEEHLIEVD